MTNAVSTRGYKWPSYISRVSSTSSNSNKLQRLPTRSLEAFERTGTDDGFSSWLQTRCNHFTASININSMTFQCVYK